MKLKVNKEKFNRKKEKQLARKDRSDKGEWDKAIVPLCDKINNKKEYYTTSSCAGRIILAKGLKKKQSNIFLYRTHEHIGIEELKKALGEGGKEYEDLVYFKQSPAILHVACQDLGAASELLQKARGSGWKRSGLMTMKNRIILELMSTEKMELPIMDNGEVLVDKEFLELLIRESNDKLERTREKIKRFEGKI